MLRGISENNYEDKWLHLSVVIFHIRICAKCDRRCYIRWLIQRNIDPVRNVKANGMCLPSFPCYRSRVEPKYSTREENSVFRAILWLDMRKQNGIYSDGKTENNKKVGRKVRSERYTFVTNAKHTCDCLIDLCITIFLSHVDYFPFTISQVLKLNSEYLDHLC